MVERTMIAAPEHREVLLTGDHADNEEVSEKRKFRQHPASFLLIHNFCTVLLREIGVGQSKPPRGWPSHARAVPPPWCRLSARRQRTVIGAIRCGETFESRMPLEEVPIKPSSGNGGFAAMPIVEISCW